MTKQEISFYDKPQTDALLDVKANAADLATVATTGSYDDLTDKPSIPAAQVNSDWNAASGVAQILNKPTLAAVATSGSYDDLTDKPTIPVLEWGNIEGTLSDQTDLKNALDSKATITDFVLLDPSVPKRMNVRTSGNYNGNTYIQMMFQYQQNDTWIDLWSGSGQLLNDTTPTANSGYYITSGRIYNALALKQDKLTVTDNTTYITLNY